MPVNSKPRVAMTFGVNYGSDVHSLVYFHRKELSAKTTWLKAVERAKHYKRKGVKGKETP